MYKDTLVFASANAHKVEEVAAKMHHDFRLKSLMDIGCTDELPETGNTLQENAQQKARYVWEKFKVNVFADDTGLEVAALGGAPGVHTAFFGGAEKRADLNKARLLRELNSVGDRTAQFRTVICLIIDGQEFLFEGVAKGHIAQAELGEGGFGYDPLFIPEGEQRSFAQMTLDEKNTISHRGKAIAALHKFLIEL